MGRKDPKKPTQSLSDAIDEEVAAARAGTTTGEIPIETQVAKKRIEPLREVVVREARKPRTLVLLLLLLAVVLELAVVKWTEDASQALEEQRGSAPGGDVPEPNAVPRQTESALPVLGTDASTAADAGTSAEAGANADGGEAIGASDDRHAPTEPGKTPRPPRSPKTAL